MRVQLNTFRLLRRAPLYYRRGVFAECYLLHYQLKIRGYQLQVLARLKKKRFL
jgi:hypothetical protein